MTSLVNSIRHSGVALQTFSLSGSGPASDRKDIQKGVSVSVPPTIQDTQHILKVNDNGLLAMDCLADGVPSPKITWRKDGKDITGEFASRWMKEKVSPADAGR